MSGGMITTSTAVETMGDETGFTLVEVIAAFAILALAFGVLMTVISNGLRQSAQAERAAEASAVAQSLLARVGTEVVLATGQRSGRNDNGLSWRLRTDPYREAGERPQGPIYAYRVTAEVLWQDGVQNRSVTLSTLRLGPGEPAR